MAGLDKEAVVKFLTKDIPTDYIEFMANWIKREIHRQSFIPDVDELKFSGAASGVAIDKFIYLMEYIAVDKQSYYEIGLRKRLNLINKIKPFQDVEEISILFKRNLPNNEPLMNEQYVKLDGRGVSRKTMMERYLTWVEDPEAELEEFKEQQKEMKDTMFDLEEEDGDTESDEEFDQTE